MKYVRGLAVWLGAPVLASALCTTVWSWTASDAMSDRRIAVSLGLASLMFTIGGSTFLALLFAGMNALPIIHRYSILVGVGALAGGATMVVLGTTTVGIEVGAIYGVATGCLWVGLHRIVYGSR